MTEAFIPSGVWLNPVSCVSNILTNILFVIWVIRNYSKTLNFFKILFKIHNFNFFQKMSQRFRDVLRSRRRLALEVRGRRGQRQVRLPVSCQVIQQYDFYIRGSSINDVIMYILKFWSSPSRCSNFPTFYINFPGISTDLLTTNTTAMAKSVLTTHLSKVWVMIAQIR